MDDENDSGIVDASSYASTTSLQSSDTRFTEMSQSLSFLASSRSPDLFLDADDSDDFVSKFEKSASHQLFDKNLLASMEQTLKGVLPPPSVTSIDLTVTELLNKYYNSVKLFNTEDKLDRKILDSEACTKLKQRSQWERVEDDITHNKQKFEWPEVLKHVYHNVHYNVTPCAEKVEQLAGRCAERCLSAETESSITVFTNKAAERKQSLIIKTAQVRSPGRRLSHLARRRQTFNSVGNYSTGLLKMVQLDKNYFPHRKLTYNPGLRKSPRLNKTSDKNTPTSKTVGRKSSGKKTPKSKSTPTGSSTKKKAVRRLLIDTDSTAGVKSQINKSRRSLFTSPVNKSNNIIEESVIAGKRKRDIHDTIVENRSKIARSLSFGGDYVGETRASGCNKLTKSATEVFPQKKSIKLNELHKKKLLWAVSEGLRSFGVKLGEENFRAHATNLARLLKRLIVLPEYEAQMATQSTSETMLKLARKHAFSIIQGKSIDDCFREETEKLAASSINKLNGYVSISEYRKLQEKLPSSKKENPLGVRRSSEKKRENVLADKTAHCNSDSNKKLKEQNKKTSLVRSFTVPTYQEAAKLKARRQISFDFG